MEDHLRNRHRLESDWELYANQVDEEQALCSIVFLEINEKKNHYNDCVPCKLNSVNYDLFTKVVTAQYDRTSVDIYFLLLSLVVSLLLYVGALSMSLPVGHIC